MSNSALICIDFQKGFDEPVWGNRNNAQAENNIALLLSYWRTREFPVIHVKHFSLEENSPLRADRPGSEFKAEAKPLVGEKIFSKSVNSAFIGTELEKYLRDSEIDSLVIAGLTTDHCVSTSTRMAGNLGFNVSLVSDATATFDRTGVDGIQYSAEQMHQIHLASLNGEFCTVLTCQEVLNSYGKE
jgi:nicotinamidase-related amidase